MLASRILPLTVLFGLLAVTVPSAGQGGPGRLELLPANPVLVVGEMEALVAGGTFFRASRGNTRFLTSATWNSSNPAVANVNSNGQVTALQAGFSFIRARRGPFHGEVRVQIVSSPLQSITISPADVSISKGLTQPLVATATLQDSNTVDVTHQVIWSSSNPAIAGVSNGTSSQGILMAVAQGSATITATLGQLQATAHITVLPPVVASIAVSPVDSQLPIGFTRQFTALATLTDKTTQDVTAAVTWSSTTGSGEVDQSGLATAVALGSTTISARASNNVVGGTALFVLPGRSRSGYVRFTHGSSRNVFVNTAVYDSVHQLLFANNQVENRVEVLSGTPYRIVASIDVPNPLGLELLPDASALLVPSLDQIYVIDPVKLEVKKKVFVPCLAPGGCGDPSTPIRAVATSNGNVFVLLLGNTLLRWNLTTGMFTQEVFPANGVIRSRDHSSVLIDNAGRVRLYDANADMFTHEFDYCCASFANMSANHNGSRFIVNGEVLDATLQPIATVPGGSSAATIFSRSGHRLYICNESPLGSPIKVLDTATLTQIGEVADIRLQGHPSNATPLDIDGNELLIGAIERGVSFVDVSNPSVLPASAPVLGLPNALSPPQAPLTSEFQVAINGAAFTEIPSVWFGPTFAPSVALESSNVLRVVAAPSSIPGPVNVTLNFPSGRFVLAPDGFTYGPTIVGLVTNAGPVQGSTPVVIMGYGFDFPASQFSVTIGGQPAPVLSVFAFPPLIPYSLPLHQISVATPPGQAGLADVTVQTPAGSTTLHGGFRYFDLQNVTAATTFSAILYDEPRERLFLGGKDGRLYEFSLTTNSFTRSLGVGGRIEEMAITPDGSTLLLANPPTLSIDVVHLNSFSLRQKVSPLKLPPTGSCPVDSRPMRVVATSLGKAFFSSHCIPLGELDLTTLAITARNGVVSTSFPHSFCSVDGSKVLMHGGQFVGMWDSQTDLFTGPFFAARAGECAFATDGTTFAAGQSILTPALKQSGVVSIKGFMETFDHSAFRQAEYLDSTGALLFGASASGIDIYAAHRGTHLWRLAVIPVQNQPGTLEHHRRVFDSSRSGKKLFVVTANGFSIARLQELPLAFGSVTPASSGIAGGTTITIRGTNFKPGAVVSLDGVALPTTWLDENTLTAVTAAHAAGSVRVTITNPDGEPFHVDAAFTFN